MKNYTTANAYYNRQSDYAKTAFDKDNNAKEICFGID